MADPWADVDGAGAEFLEMATTALETRGEDPQMIPIIEKYLGAVQWPDDGLTVEIGCGSGAVTHRIARHAHPGRVLAVDPSKGLIGIARDLHPAENIDYEIGDGATLALGDAVVDVVVLHTVLSHVEDPESLFREAVRVLKPGGCVIICDADFSKLALEIEDGDPLGALTDGFRRHSVTQLYLTGRLRAMAGDLGLEIASFEIANRVTMHGAGALAVLKLTAAHLVKLGVIGEPLAKALADEYMRRDEAGILYGFLPFVTLIANKASASQ